MKDENSNWRRESGNLFSDVVTFDTGTAGLAPVQLALKNVAKEMEPKANNVEFVKVRSKLLSDFQKRDVYLRGHRAAGELRSQSRVSRPCMKSPVTAAITRWRS